MLWADETLTNSLSTFPAKQLEIVCYSESEEG